MEKTIKSARLYDRAKFVALVLLPGLATFYLSVSDVLDLPYAFQVVGTLTAFDTLLGTLLGLSSKAHSDGTMEVTQTVNDDNEPMTLFSMDFSDDQLEHLADKKRVVFKVESN